MFFHFLRIEEASTTVYYFPSICTLLASSQGILRILGFPQPWRTCCSSTIATRPQTLRITPFTGPTHTLQFFSSRQRVTDRFRRAAYSIVSTPSSSTLLISEHVVSRPFRQHLSTAPTAPCGGLLFRRRFLHTSSSQQTAVSLRCWDSRKREPGSCSPGWPSTGSFSAQ